MEQCLAGTGAAALAVLACMGSKIMQVPQSSPVSGQVVPCERDPELAQSVEEEPPTYSEVVSSTGDVGRMLERGELSSRPSSLAVQKECDRANASERRHEEQGYDAGLVG